MTAGRISGLTLGENFSPSFDGRCEDTGETVVGVTDINNSLVSD
jgi:hypothetical protein